MSDTSFQPVDLGIGNSPERRPVRRRWQVGLRTLFLLTAVIAVWMTVLINREQNKSIEARIQTLRPLARELVIDDPNKIAVVKREERWYDENRWDIHLPAGQYWLCVATRGIDQNGFAPVVKSERIEAGRHGLELEQKRVGTGWQVNITQDGTKRLSLEEPQEWDPATGSSGGGQYSLSTQLPADKPFVLFRRRFTRPNAQGQVTTPIGPCDGILLWIERVKFPNHKF
ncbi:hypothetical protein V5E97_02850 [Singulisphaera sp. Ch08]|uniref:Uncharacterized protein n=1 Tax=Singulisphaera sp. Ch08 TaxID=3120278 RepID=A0AAU7CII2_9BACT